MNNSYHQILHPTLVLNQSQSWKQPIFMIFFWGVGVKFSDTHTLVGKRGESARPWILREKIYALHVWNSVKINKAYEDSKWASTDNSLARCACWPKIWTKACKFLLLIITSFFWQKSSISRRMSVIWKTMDTDWCLGC